MDEKHYETLKQFKESSTVIQFALDSRDGSVTSFPQDLRTKQERDEYRALCKEHFVCIVDSCRGSLNPHFRTAITPGYVHLDPGTSHGETAWHQLAKVQILRWAEQKGGSAQQEQTSEEVSRRPDVTIVTPTGAKIAVEVQYSRIGAEEHADRDLALSSAYDSVVWLFGHVGPNAIFRGATGSQIFLNKVARRMLESGRTLLWINPTDAGAILTPWDNTPHGPQSPTGTTASAWEIVPLSECSLDDVAGIVSPAADRIGTARNRREQLRQAARHRAEQDRLQLQRERERARALWEQSDDREWLAVEHSNGLSLPLTATRPGDQQLAARLGVTCEHWKTHVLRHISRSASWVGWAKTCGALNELARHGPIRLTETEHAALGGHLRDLGRLGLIVVVGKDDRPTTGAPHMKRSQTRRRTPTSPRPVLPSQDVRSLRATAPEPDPPRPAVIVEPAAIPTHQAPPLEPTSLPDAPEARVSTREEHSSPHVASEARLGVFRRVWSYLFDK